MENMKKLLNEFKRTVLTERQWILKIDIRDLWTKWSDVFDDDYTDEDFRGFKADLIPKLKSYTEKINTKLGEEASTKYKKHIDVFEKVNNLTEFNRILEELYNFAEVYGIWIGTF